MIDVATVEAFLAGHRIALVGASSAKGSFAPAVYRALVDHGYEVVPVHPTQATFEGVACAPDLASVPGELDGVLVMVGSSRAADAVRECIDRGVTKVWLFQGLGGGTAASPEAVRLCEEHGIDVVAGACPLMFLDPVGVGHRIHRFFRRTSGALVGAR